MLWLIGFFIVFIIILLVVIVAVSRKPKPDAYEVTPKIKVDCSLESLIEVLKSETTEISKVNETLEKMILGFPFPENKNQAGEHFKYVYFYAKNPLTTAKMIVQMQKRLTQDNPQYAKQIEDFQMRGVESRKK